MTAEDWIKLVLRAPTVEDLQRIGAVLRTDATDEIKDAVRPDYDARKRWLTSEELVPDLFDIDHFPCGLTEWGCSCNNPRCQIYGVQTSGNYVPLVGHTGEGGRVREEPGAVQKLPKKTKKQKRSMDNRGLPGM